MFLDELEEGSEMKRILYLITILLVGCVTTGGPESVYGPGGYHDQIATLQHEIQEKGRSLANRGVEIEAPLTWEALVVYSPTHIDLPRTKLQSRYESMKASQQDNAKDLADFYKLLIEYKDVMSSMNKEGFTIKGA